MLFRSYPGIGPFLVGFSFLSRPFRSTQAIALLWSAPFLGPIFSPSFVGLCLSVLGTVTPGGARPRTIQQFLKARAQNKVSRTYLTRYLLY